MSQQNADTVRRLWDSWKRRGVVDASLFDPDVIYEDANLPDHAGETYHGPEGVARATERWLEPFESLEIDLERVAGTGDRLVSIHHVRMKARHTGIEMEGPLAYLYTFRDGRIVHFRSYMDPGEALELAGLAG